MVKLPDLGVDFTDILIDKPEDLEVVFRFTNNSLDRLLLMFKFARDEKSTDIQVFYYEGTMVFLKEQLDATKAGAVPVTLVQGNPEDVQGVLINLDYALLSQIQSTMKQIEREDLVIEINKGTHIKYILGSFELPSTLKSTTLLAPYSTLDETKLTKVLPVSELGKILDISFNSTESSHSALDNIFMDGSDLIGGTRGLLYRTTSLLPELEGVIGFNYKYYSDIASFSSLSSGEITITLGVSKIRGKDRSVLEFTSYDSRLVIPLADVDEGNVGIFNTLVSQLTNPPEDKPTTIASTVKAVKRSLNCMELALYNLKTTHKTTLSSEDKTVVMSATPLTNEKATDILTCTIDGNDNEITVNLGNQYMFDALASYEADDTIYIEIPQGENPSRVRIFGKVKSGQEKSWALATYE